jgi:hypothetical protein
MILQNTLPATRGSEFFFYNYMLLSPSTATEYLLKALGWTSVRFPSHTLGSLSPPNPRSSNRLSRPEAYFLFLSVPA